MDEIDQKIAKRLSEITDFRRELHAHPEPAFEEFETAGRVVAYLKSVPNIEIRRGVATTGIVATLGAEKAGPCICLRADMDCLRMVEKNRFDHASVNEGCMHGCGHDGHTAMLVGAAVILGEIQDQLEGPVKFLFQPAEENKGGARVMIEEGALTQPDVAAVFGIHGTTALPLNQIGFRAGPMMAASKYFTIVIQGRGCHAASPHRGIDPVLVGSQVICSLQSIISRNVSPLEAGLISIPKFTGSTAPNVIPEQVTLEGTLRALSNENREYLERRLRELVVHTAKAHGAEAEIDFYGGYPLLENDPDMVDYLARVAGSSFGEEWLHADYPPSMGAEDFAFYLQNVPGVFCWLGLQPEGPQLPPLHHPEFDFNDQALARGIRLHCEIARNFAIS